jgi:NodT family efflux transporter outer membrane factor (OMF) lipoprotein
MSFARTIVAALAACSIAIAGCTPGPKYTRPVISAPPAFKELGNADSGLWKPAQPGDGLDRGKWWTRFDDPALNELEDRLNISNQNVAAVLASLLASRAIVREARAQYFPTVSVGVSVTNERLSTVFGSPLQRTFTIYSLPLAASWEPDLWGRVRNNVKVNEFAAQATAADLENVRLSTQADLAATYYELRGTDALIQVLDSTVSSYQEEVALNLTLLESGLASDEAVAQAEAQLKSAQAQAASTRIIRAQYEHAIAVLVGEHPSTFSIPAVSSLKPTPPAIPVALPSELLERRPDIASAERVVAQANAQIGLAETAFFPTLLLNPTAGFESSSLSNWLTWPARFWAVGPALVQTIFDGGLRRATVQQFKAAYEETVANYRQTVLTAFQQVEDNLAALRILSEAVQQQESAVEAAARSLEHATIRYKAGLDPYLNVVVAESILLSYQQTLVTFRMQQMVASVQLIKSLGGGWDTSQL